MPRSETAETRERNRPLRVVVSPSERARIEVSPPPTLTLHTGGDTPSSVTLPVRSAR